MDWVVAILIGAIGSFLAAVRSAWLLDYAIFMFVVNRGLRRLIDYYVNHEFNPLSPISLTPLILAAVMAFRCVTDWRRLPLSARQMFWYLLGAVAYAFAIGFLHVRFGSVYALGEVLGPLALAGYVMILNPSLQVRDRWVRSFSWGAIFASAYGWYQYLTIPPWDAFWLERVGFIGYMGIPEPTKMTVFSTMAERGPLAAYLGFAVVPMIVSARWRTWLSWPAVVLVFSVILLTASRGGLMIAIIGTVVFLLVNRGANKGQIVLAAFILATAAWFGLERIPNSENVIKRFGTLSNIQRDGSYQGRVENMAGGVAVTFRNPLGFGLGAAGLGTRVNTGSIQTMTTFGDAGYFQIVLVYGVVGTSLLLYGLYLAWKRLAIRYQVPLLRNEHVLLARALMIATLITCWLGDMLTGFSLFWLALGCGLAVRPEAVREIRRRSEQRQADLRIDARAVEGSKIVTQP
jgi:hypothetical protein